MDASRAAATVALVLLTVALLATPTHGATMARSPTTAGVPVFAPSPTLVLPQHSAAQTLMPATPVPMTGYPRTVLVETFTGVWCIHCPGESQALHYISEDMNSSVVNVAELHVCAFAPGSGPCLDNYVPPDGTSDARGVFYNDCGLPDVFFDGIDSRPPLTSNCGALPSASTMQAQYEQYITAAQSFPGNVSISQSGIVSSSDVTGQVAITSAINGSYNLVTYLMENINKMNLSNGYGPHDVDTIVRETLYNHPVTLTPGATTTVAFRGYLDPSWNTLNLSLISLVQQNSTKIIENSGSAPISTLTTAVATDTPNLHSAESATVSVHVANSSTGLSLSGAFVNLSSNAGGSFSPTGGVTDANGDFSAVFQAPAVTSVTSVVVTAQAEANGYAAGSGTTVFTVDPLVAPQVPTSALIVPGSEQVLLNWSAPASGQGGVTYHVFRATSATGTFYEVNAGTSLGYTDTDVTAGHCYWYEIAAQNTVGFSPNTTVVSATALSVVPQALPTSVGWWFSIDGQNFSSSPGVPMSLYLPGGFVSYQYGPASYAYLAADPFGALAIGGDPLTLNVSFAPRYAILQETITPSTASVTINGTSVSLTDGSFTEYLAAGTYDVNISASGYVSNLSAVTLTPGNLSQFSVSLHAVPGGGASSSSSNGGLSNVEVVGIVVGAVFVVAAIAGVFLLTQGRRRSR